MYSEKSQTLLLTTYTALVETLQEVVVMVREEEEAMVADVAEVVAVPHLLPLEPP